MTLAVEFETGPAPGRRLRIEEGHSRSLRVLYQGQEAGQVVFTTEDGQLRLDNRSGRPVTVNGVTVTQATLALGDQVVIGKDRAVIILDEEMPPGSSSDSQRRRRALSAEGVAASASSGRQGLISRVSNALTTRAERGREEELQRHRQDLLLQVGRRALAGERFGLPAVALQELSAGRAVRLDPAEVDREALAWWRQARDRLALIDAEIAALRKVAGLPPDPGIEAPPMIRKDLQQQEERTYQALDELATQDLESLPRSGSEASLPKSGSEASLPKSGSEESGSSGRRRSSPLRRHRS